MATKSQHAPRYDKARSADINAAARLVTLAFAGSMEVSIRWIKANGLKNWRLVRDGRNVVACLRRIEMGQFFGGRRVSLIGVAGVATAPESRGRGHARMLMESCVREMHKDGAALGGLYASTQALYRQSGFEQAGHRFVARIPVARLAIGPKKRNIVALTEADQPRIVSCYQRFAPTHNGLLDRGEYIWKRIRERPDTKYLPYGVPGERGQLDGYLFMAQARDPQTMRQELILSDLVFHSADAARQLIAFLADFEPMADTLVFTGGPLHPILTLLPQQRFEVKLKEYWMLRIVNITKALQERGYSPAIRGSVVLRVTDDLIDANAGTWRLDVEAGEGRLRRVAGGSAVSCDIRGLAALYTGLLTPRQAAQIGLCAGDDRSLDTLGAIFAGGTPWMGDQY